MSNKEVLIPNDLNSIYSYSLNPANELHVFKKEIVIVKGTIGSRYENFERPSSWDKRQEGIDIILLDTKENTSNDFSEFFKKNIFDDTIYLWSNGGQSPPKPGWKILLTSFIDISSLTPKISIDKNSVQNLKSIKPANAFIWTLYGFDKGN